MPLSPLSAESTSRRRFLLSTGALTLGLLPLVGCATAKNPYAEAVLLDGEPPLPAPDSFTFAVLPDTQFYCETYPENFLAQTRWLVEQRSRRRIEAVFHLGDITNQNNPPQWLNAQKALRVLTDAQMPLCLVTGNHDLGPGGKCGDRTSLFSDYFPVRSMRQAAHWRGNYEREPDRSENTWHFLDVAGRRFLVLCLEFGPREEILRWANKIVAAHPEREVILLTHSLVFHDDTRHDWILKGNTQPWNPHFFDFAKVTGDDINDGEQIWKKLLSQHENFILTLNGHVVESGLGRVVTATEKGHAVPQVLVNFQMKPNGGDGWLRLIEMRQDGTMRTFDYSPTRHQVNASKRNQFTIPWA